MTNRTTGSVYDFSAPLLSGEMLSLSAFQGKVLLIVNTASKCGFTPQYAALEEIYRAHKAQGFEVLGFPCNQFGAQEPGDAQQIAAFCERNYGVSFPMFAKIEVNGPGTHPLFAFLKKSKPGIFGTKKIKWNFTKFLVNREGQPVKRYGSRTDPRKLTPAIEACLKVR